MSTQRGDLLAKISKAASFSEQAALVSQLDDLDRADRAAHQATRDLDLASAVVTQTLTPVRTHEMHTIASDWIGDFEAPVDGAAHQASIAEAAMWYGRVSPEVKADTEEFAIQAEGFMRRQASQYGEQADAVREAGLAYLGHLYRREAASGLDQIQQTIDPNNSPKATPLNPETFDNFADEVHPINTGVVGTETSERAPLLQEIEGEAAGQGTPEKPGGHSIDNEGAPWGGPADADSGPLGYAEGSFDGRSVALNQTYTMDDFRVEAASGLDQVQQTIDPNNTPKTTPLPVDVAYPWLLGPDAYGNGGEQEEDEDDVAKTVASRKQADMFGNSDNPHAVPGPSPANTPDTAPRPGAAYAEGQADAQAGEHPTYSDASSAVPDNVRQYSQGYSDGVNAGDQQQVYPDVPVGAGGNNGQDGIDPLSAAASVSSRFTKSASRQDPAFRKGYGYARSWKPGSPLVSLGSAQFESGVFAGIADNPSARHAFVVAHRKNAESNPDLVARMRVHAAYTGHLASKGITLEAGTSTDLDTMDAGASPSLTGQTPINGPGTVPPLAGQDDPAAPGGPSPYNAAPPYGAPVVPSGVPTPGPGSQYVNDVVGGPVDGNTNLPSPATLAFRRTVQANLLTQHQQKG